MPATTPTKRPGIVIVRDGWGRNPHPEHDKFNAIKLAKTPRCDELLKTYPWTLIHTSGEDVGLPDGTMGNSEVGHQNIGAGRVVYQESVRITRAIRSGEFFTNDVLVEGVTRAKRAGKTVHLLGIASDAGVHGLMTHLYACLELCKKQGQTKVALHLFTDGRDTGPYTGKEFVRQIESECNKIGVGAVATVCGRYYAMDRDNRWERVQKAYACLTGLGVDPAVIRHAPSAEAAIQGYYDKPTNTSQQGDEFIVPTMIAPTPQASAATRITDGDTVIFYNYRGDRPREISKAFIFDNAQWAGVPASPDSDKQGFNRVKKLDVYYATMTEYEKGLPVHAAFLKPAKMINIAGEYVSNLGLRQFRCAETEKFPHVTFFFNDYREEPFPGESRQMAQSPKVATYDLQPEMSAPQIRDIVLARLAAEDCEDLIVVNFANGDMVGHTGKLDAAIKAVETVDQCVGALVDAALKRDGVLIVTADHGNAEQMFDPTTNAPHTAHTTYDVECILVDPRKKNLASGNKETGSAALNNDGRLADIVPTLLDLMGLDKPKEMEGQSLVK